MERESICSVCYFLCESFSTGDVRVQCQVQDCFRLLNAAGRWALSKIDSFIAYLADLLNIIRGAIEGINGEGQFIILMINRKIIFFLIAD